MIKYLSMFSGIGAPEQALKNIGIDYDLVGFSEVDKYAIQSYCAVHDADIILDHLGDITKIDIDSLPVNEIDLITHGSPCQDFSVAGNNKGGDEGSGTRSSLMWNTVKIVEHCKPKYVLWENVKNVLSKRHKHNFDKYINEMNRIGYNNYYKVLNAKNFGIPQNRERIFVISIRKDLNKNFEFPQGHKSEIRLKDFLEKTVDESYYIDNENYRQIVLEDNNFKTNAAIYNSNDFIIADYRYDDGVRVRRNGISPCLTRSVGSSGLSGNPLIIDRLLIKNNTKQGYLEAYPGDGIDLENLASKTRRGRVQEQSIQTINTTDHKGVLTNDFRIRKLTPLECWRLMGFKDEQFYKAAKVCSNSQLYKQAGNSIVVNVLEEIFKNLFK